MGCSCIIAVAVPASQQDKAPAATPAVVDASEQKIKVTEPEASPSTDVVDPINDQAKDQAKDQTKSEDNGKRRKRRTSMKKVKYVEEDDMSEGEEAIVADKKKRAQQLDYQLRTVRRLSDVAVAAT